MFKLITGEVMELTKHADRMIKSSRARKRRRFVNNIREMRQHRLYAKMHKLKKKRKKRFTYT